MSTKRIVDLNMQSIENPDLNNGFLTEGTAIKENATPIDNITKFMWDDNDYEEVYYYIPIPEKEKIQQQIEELKQKLFDTDYTIIKISEGVATKEEYSDILKERNEWRQQINELQEKVAALG